MTRTDQPAPAAGTRRFVPAAGRASLTALYDPVIALTMRERTFRGRLLNQTLADLDGHAPRLVDIGCGTGTFSLELTRARPDAEVIGIDGDPAILERARSKPGARRVTWHPARADELPLEDTTADRAICSLLLHHLAPETRQQALAEVRRILRPGGRLHIADWGRPRDGLTTVGAWLLQRVDGVRNTQDLIAGRLPALLNTAGFDDIVIHDRFRTPWGTLEHTSATRL
ncbi:MAG TPA: class I SAM-dependent methyltransferase [Solirubrobacteraceae bacterium]|nr:class I SAM-dependent methyltransferase [Solirubrobacteraceae bacterium]